MNDKLYSEKQIEQTVSKLLPNDVLFALGDKDKVECASIWITRLQQQNQELREELRIEKNKNYNCPAQLGKEPMNEACGGCVGCVQMQEDHYRNKQVKDLKAFIKEACGVIEFYSHTKVRSDFIGKQDNVMSSHIYDISCATCNETQKGKRARDIINNPIYKEYFND